MHRGNKLVWDHEQRGNVRSFACRFHGWSYATDGQLRAVPDEKMFYGLRKEDRGLRQVALDVWEGFIFINLDPELKETLGEFLGEMGPHLSGFPYSDYSTCYTYRAELNANWKVCLDAFSEAYHVLSVHGQTVGSANFSRENPMSHPLDVRLYPRHRSAVLGPTPSRSHKTIGGRSLARVSRAALRPDRVRIWSLVGSLRRAASPKGLPGPRPGKSQPSPLASTALAMPQGWVSGTAAAANSAAVVANGSSSTTRCVRV